MFYSLATHNNNNQTNFFNELGESFDKITSVVDKETSDALVKLFAEYKVGETIQTLTDNLRASPKAQQHLRALIQELTRPTHEACHAVENDDKSCVWNNDNDDDDNEKGEKPSACRYKAEVVKDVTLEQKDIEIGRNEKHVKVWRFRNSGDEPWPEGCKFVSLGSAAGNKWISFQLSPITAGPGQIADAGFQFVSPSEPGPYELRYALVSGDNTGVMTSEPLILSFTVVEKVKHDLSPPKSSSSSPPSQPPPKSSSSSPSSPYKRENTYKQLPSTSTIQASSSPVMVNLCDGDEDDDVDMCMDVDTNTNMSVNSDNSIADNCIRELNMMGVINVDRSRIQVLVEKYNGDINRVVDEYLS